MARVLLTLAALSSLSSRVVSTPPWCAPGAPCWPSAAQWAALNTSVGGRLLAVTPPLLPCALYGASSPACVAVQANQYNSVWSTTTPGAMYSPEWETNITSGAGCINPQAWPVCSQGSVPPYAVAVASAADVSAALAFAAAHNIRIAIKSSGHDYQGRSTAPNALLVWMRRLNGVTVLPAFSACAGVPPVPAIQVTGGVPWSDVYAAADAAGYAVVGGSAATVCAGGGFFLGGGHSVLSPEFGLAVDNALAATVVLANGTLVKASPCAHPDLFWALRGGGGGSFGVLMSVTYRLRPRRPVTGLTLFINLLRGAASARVLADAVLGSLPGLTARSGVVMGGFGFFTQGLFTMRTVFNGSSAQAEAAVAPVLAAVAAHPADLTVQYSQYAPAASYNAWQAASGQNDVGAGTPATMASRLIPTATLRTAALRAPVSTLISQLYAASGFAFVLDFDVGGAVSTSDSPTAPATSVTPAFRAAAARIEMFALWPVTASPADVSAAFAKSLGWTRQLRAALPNSGTYVNEADYNEPDWAVSFWGAPNYARLQSIKAKYDPRGVFTCHHCVELPVAGAAVATGAGEGGNAGLGARRAAPS